MGRVPGRTPSTLIWSLTTTPRPVWTLASWEARPLPRPNTKATNSSHTFTTSRLVDTSSLPSGRLSLLTTWFTPPPTWGQANPWSHNSTGVSPQLATIQDSKGNVVLKENNFYNIYKLQSKQAYNYLF